MNEISRVVLATALIMAPILVNSEDAQVGLTGAATRGEAAPLALPLNQVDGAHDMARIESTMDVVVLQAVSVVRF